MTGKAGISLKYGAKMMDGMREMTGLDRQPVTASEVETIGRVLYECEKKRAEHCQSVLQKASGRECSGAAMEPWEECSEVFLSDAAAVLAALAHSRPHTVEVASDPNCA